MDKLIKDIIIGDKVYHLGYTVQTMTEVNDILKQDDSASLELVDVILTDKYFDEFCEILSAMIRAGELYRRHQGYEKESILSPEDIKALLMPAELIDVRTSCMEAVLAAFRREEDNSETDLGLAQLEKKKSHQGQA